MCDEDDEDDMMYVSPVLINPYVLIRCVLWLHIQSFFKVLKSGQIPEDDSKNMKSQLILKIWI